MLISRPMSKTWPHAAQANDTTIVPTNSALRLNKPITANPNPVSCRATRPSPQRRSTLPNIQRFGPRRDRAVPARPSAPPIADTDCQTYSSSLGIVSSVLELVCRGRKRPASPVSRKVNNRPISYLSSLRLVMCSTSPMSVLTVDWLVAVQVVRAGVRSGARPARQGSAHQSDDTELVHVRRREGVGPRPHREHRRRI